MTRHHMTADGPIPFTPEEDAEWEATELSAGNNSWNSNIKSQIAALEATQPRALREAALSMDGALARLQTLEDQIATLRAQLK